MGTLLSIDFSNPLILVILGIGVASLGTLVGAGGGFILSPLLVFILPSAPTDRITAISNAVVFCNALSGTIAYTRMRRVDFRAGWRFALAAIPGAFLGAVATHFISRHFFEVLLGGALIAIAAYLFRKTFRAPAGQIHDKAKPFFLEKYAMLKGCLLSVAIGFVSSILGIGGGIIHVPALTYMLGYPVHLATATSHFVLSFTGLTAVVEHVINDSYRENMHQTVFISIGALIGAQIGAKLSNKLSGPVIIRVLAVAQLLVGLRVILKSLA